LVLGGSGEGGEPPRSDHLHPLLRPDGEAAERALPNHRREAGAIVLEVDVEMARGRARDAAELGADADAGELALDDPLHRAGDLRDGELRRVGARDRGFEHFHRPLACAAFWGTIERGRGEAKRKDAT
jgi:hypothetical protein